MNNLPHSPTPWRSKYDLILDANGESVCIVNGDMTTAHADTDNAAYIVACVNARAESEIAPRPDRVGRGGGRAMSNRGGK